MSEFAVVVPIFNEARGLQPTLDALAAQADRDFLLLLVDNASTDGSAEVARAFARVAPFPVELLHEAQKGTGAASDTGFRAAIARGARFIARTDADCLPHPEWVRRLRGAMRAGGLEFVAGRIRPREDEGPVSRFDRVALAFTIWLAENYGRTDPARRGPQFKIAYFLAAGNNLAITADLYERAGGFPRTSIEEAHEDLELSERVRTLTTRAGVRDDVIVYNSARRVRAWGYINTLRWYRNHGYRPANADVR